MKPREFFEKVNSACAEYNQSAPIIWAHIPLDEWQWVMDTEQGFEAFKTCLKDWKGHKFEVNNDAEYPRLSCYDCKHLDKGNCLKLNKKIPEYFDKSKGCKFWNDEL